MIKVNHKRVKNITLGFVSLVPQQPGVVDPSMEMALGNMEKRMKSAAALGNAYQSGFQNWQPLEFTEKWKTVNWLAFNVLTVILSFNVSMYLLSLKHVNQRELVLSTSLIVVSTQFKLFNVPRLYGHTKQQLSKPNHTPAARGIAYLKTTET